MLVQALLAGLVVGLSKMEYFFGYSMFNRPIVEAPSWVSFWATP